MLDTIVLSSHTVPHATQTASPAPKSFHSMSWLPMRCQQWWCERRQLAAAAAAAAVVAAAVAVVVAVVAAAVAALVAVVVPMSLGDEGLHTAGRARRGFRHDPGDLEGLCSAFPRSRRLGLLLLGVQGQQISDLNRSEMANLRA